MENYGLFGFPDARNLTVLGPKWRNKASFKNWEQFNQNVQQLLEIVVNIFKWTLPESCNPRALELTLISNGKALFFHDTTNLTLGYGDVLLHTPFIYEGPLNIYYEHTGRRAYSINYNKLYSMDNSVVCRNNCMEFPSIVPIMIYAEKYCDSGRTIDVYAKTMKRPWAASASRDTEVTAEVISDQVDENEVLVIFNGNNLRADDFDVMSNNNNTGNLLDLWVHRKNVYYEFLELFGINTANTDKRERLLGAEVEANNEIADINIGNLLRWRKKCCDEINKMFPGANASVELNEEYIKELTASVEEQNTNTGNAD